MTAALAPLNGIHHVSVITRDARENHRFYTQTLGLRLVKKTVNFDTADSYHLYYGDHAGTPGTLLTFFELRHAVHGHPGRGGTHHIALSVGSGAVLAYWRGRLERSGLDVEGPFDDHGFPTIRFRDPDGLILELCAPAGEDVPDGAPDLYVPAMAIGPIHHVALHATEPERGAGYYRDLLGLDRLGEGPNRDDPALIDTIFSVGAARLIVTFTARERTDRFKLGAGQTHHIAFGVEDAGAQHDWHERFLHAGVNATDIQDRLYFTSIYFHDPDAHVLEIATDGPGFTIDEPLDALGSELRLPPWLEHRRPELEASLGERL